MIDEQTKGMNIFEEYKFIRRQYGPFRSGMALYISRDIMSNKNINKAEVFILSMVLQSDNCESRLSCSEICEIGGSSCSTIKRAIKNLIRKGYLLRVGHKLKVVDESEWGKIKEIKEKNKKEILVVDTNKCSVCGWVGPCDKHRIKAGKDGGEYINGNIISACPNCHRLIHRKKTKQLLEKKAS